MTKLTRSARKAAGCCTDSAHGEGPGAVYTAPGPFHTSQTKIKQTANKQKVRLPQKTGMQVNVHAATIYICPVRNGPDQPERAAALSALLFCSRLWRLAVGGAGLLGAAQRGIQPAGTACSLPGGAPWAMGADLWGGRGMDGAAPCSHKAGPAALFPDLCRGLRRGGVSDLLGIGSDVSRAMVGLHGLLPQPERPDLRHEYSVLRSGGHGCGLWRCPLLLAAGQACAAARGAGVCISLTLLFLLDLLRSLVSPNLGVGVLPLA